ncbi:hypothetical protein AH68_09375 [Bifidobacterium catenulatum PV20-2]|uniref:Uncharacterized protein n=1 Tax=Bifidobacterium catenulatum PV20-2 TaxID=1447716 RepID=A0A0A7I5L1_9BIFI|nr:hypothetical protein AH68_09375 [Bifidobacterium catenulatum PV20-2]
MVAVSCFFSNSGKKILFLGTWYVPCKQTIDDGTDEKPCNAASMSDNETRSSDNIRFQGVMSSFQNIENRILAKSAHRHAKATELTDECPSQSRVLPNPWVSN